jgi:hypothetical protein
MKNIVVKTSMAALLCLALSLTATLAIAAPTGWFIRVIAENTAEKLSDPSNVLGLMSDSINTYDSHDLIEMAPFGTPYLTLVFPHPEWGAKAGDYTTEFQAQNKLTHIWNFEVRSDKTTRNVTLRWEGDKAKLLKSTLRDVKTSKTYNIGATKNLTFTMGATKRLFVWTVQP